MQSSTGDTFLGLADETPSEAEPMTGIESDSGTVTRKCPRDEGKEDKGTTAASPGRTTRQNDSRSAASPSGTAKHFDGAQDGRTKRDGKATTVAARVPPSKANLHRRATLNPKPNIPPDKRSTPTAAPR
ncbi:hypothetical protein MRX96_023684 [Rhipicephalus microplus]